MPEVLIKQHPDGFAMALGANVRPTDPREMKYAFTKVRPPRVVDLSQARLLSRYNNLDCRPEVMNQANLGSCAAVSGIGTARLLAKELGRFDTTPMLTGDWVYEQVRKKEGTFPQDAGSFPGDVQDLLLGTGAPLESDYPEQHNAAYDYGTLDPSVLSDQIWTLSHHPFYPTEGNVLENIWVALDAGYPIQLATAWMNQWFNPTKGVLTTDFVATDAVGGHAIYVWGIVPSGSSGFVLCSNQWTSGWAADAPQSGLTDMRGGDFAIPWSILTMPNTPVFELRAVAPKPYSKPQPKPIPQDFSASLPFWKWLAAYHPEVLSVLEKADPADQATFEAWRAWLITNGFISG